MGARVFTIAVGAWLLVAAFVLPHSTAARTNALACAVLAAGSAALALSVPKARYGGLVAGTWLFFSPWAFALHESALWNTLVCALGIFIASLIPSTVVTAPMPRLPRRPRTA